MKILWAVILSLTILSFQNFAQEKGSYSLSGVVEDSVLGTGLANANISIISRKDGKIITGTTANKKGYFSIDKISEKVIRAKFSMVGYQTKIIDSISLENNSRIGVVKLFATTILMPAVVIKTIKPMIDFRVDKDVINIDQVPGSNGSLTDALKNTGLVDVDPQSNAISVRGQNVKIEMDGHPFEMPADMLTQLPASTIEKVEVILSPGAKESAEGGTYILNIITKKNILNNFNGAVSLSTTSNNRSYGGLNLNYKVNKLNLFLSGFLGLNKFNYNSFSEKLNYNSTSFSHLNSNSSGESNGGWGNIKLGFDYDFDASNSITFFGSYNRNKSDNSTLSGSLVENNFNQFQYNYAINNSSSSSWNVATLYGYYKKKFLKDGAESKKPVPELTVDAYYTNIFNPSSSQMNTFYNYLAGTPQLHNSGQVQNANTFIFRTNYVLPSKIGRFETGYNFTYRHRQNENNALDFSYLTYSWADSLHLSNDFRYQEDIHALYLSYSNDFGKFGVKAGLRAENLHSNGNQVTSNEEFNRNFLNLFPNLNLSYRLSQMLMVTANAFRRVVYPPLYFVNPYVNYNGPNSYSAGNPDIKPYCVNSFAVGLSQYLNFYYNFTTGQYQYATANVQDSISFNSPINLTSNKLYGVDVSFPYFNSPMALFHLPDFISNFNIRFSYRYSTTSGNYLTEDLTDWGYSKSLNASLGLKLWSGIDASFYLYYTPETASKKYISNSNTYLSIYLSKSFFKNKLKISLNAWNVLNYDNYDRQTYGTDYYMRSDFTVLQSRTITFGITYMFNNYKERHDQSINDSRDTSGEQQNQ